MTTLNQMTLGIDALWVLISAALIFLMQAGFKSLEVGLVRKKHIETVAIKNVIDWVIASLVFLLFGFGIMFGESETGFFGSNLFLQRNFDDIAGGHQLGTIFFMFQLAFAGTAVTIVSGAMSERMGFIPYMTASVLIVLLIYPVFGHWAWGNAFFPDNNSWLADLGFIDFAGSSVVHSVGGWVSLAGLILLGPRLGRYNADGSPREVKPYNIAYASLGVFLLWLGWWGFNGGSTLSFNKNVGTIILNTNVAGAIAALTAYSHCYWFQQKKAIYEKVIGGALAGLVAITASAHIQTILTTLIIGLAAGVIHNIAYELLIRKGIDDAVGAIPIHAFGGALGSLLVVISPEVLFPAGTFSASNFLKQFAIQGLGVLVCFIWAFGTAYVMFKILKKTVGLRVSPEEERQGVSLFPRPEAMNDESDVDQDELERLLEQMS